MAKTKVNQDEMAQLIQVGQTGTVGTIAAASDANISVTFPRAFAATPVVMATAHSSNITSWSTAVNATVHNVTTTGCTLVLRNTGAGACGIVYGQWMAVGS